MKTITKPSPIVEIISLFSIENFCDDLLVSRKKDLPIDIFEKINDAVNSKEYLRLKERVIGFYEDAFKNNPVLYRKIVERYLEFADDHHTAIALKINNPEHPFDIEKDRLKAII